jgi:hypothetical protein
VIGQNLVSDAKKVCSKRGARLISLRGAQDHDKSLLREFFRARRILHAPPEKCIDQLPVAKKKFAEGFAGAFLEFKDQLLVSRHQNFRCSAIESPLFRSCCPEALVFLALYYV